MKEWFLHWRQRWRIAELRLLWLALVVAVTAVTAVGFFTSRVDHAMQSQARQLLGGDLVLVSSRPLAQDNLQQAQALGLSSAETVTFPSMAGSGDKLQLVQVKAVSTAYPLRGVVKTADAPGAADSVSTGQLPATGEIWAEARLFAELGITTDARVQLGQSTFRLSRVLVQEPDRSSNLFQLAPVVLMNLSDLDATGLLSPASRASFSQLFAGQDTTVRQLRASLEPRLKPVERIRTLKDDLASVQQTLQRGGRFLGLAALLAVVLAGAAVALTVNSLLQREVTGVAVLKAMGLSRWQVLLDQSAGLLLTAVLGALLGSMLGGVLQAGLANWLGQLLQETLPAPDVLPVLAGGLTAILLLLGFALPPLLHVVNVAPVAVLRGMEQPISPSVWLVAGSVLLAVFGLLWLQARDVELAGWLLLLLAGGVSLFWLLAGLILRLLQRLGQHAGWGWLIPLGHSRRAVLLVVVFGVGLFALLLLVTVRNDLLDRWETSLPADAPDHFLINVQPAEVAPLQHFLADRGIDIHLYPMIRGRLVAVNGKPVAAEQFESQRARHLLEREFNLSSFAELPASNALVAGQWFDGMTTGFSVEKGIGETLQFGLGDTLTFDVAGQQVSERITSVREVRWDTLQPNFFVVAAPGGLAGLPHTFITSIHLGKQKQLITELVHRFPGVTAIDVGAIVGEVRALVGRVALAVQGIFGFTVLAGLVVLWAALQSQRAERQQELAILKALGAGESTLQRRIWAEFLLLGALAGLLAGLLAMTAGNVAGYYLFDLGLYFSFWPLIAGMVSGGLLVGVAGYLNLRGLLTVLPVTLLGK